MPNTIHISQFLISFSRFILLNSFEISTFDPNFDFWPYLYLVNNDLSYHLTYNNLFHRLTYVTYSTSRPMMIYSVTRFMMTCSRHSTYDDLLRHLTYDDPSCQRIYDDLFHYLTHGGSFYCLTCDVFFLQILWQLRTAHIRNCAIFLAETETVTKQSRPKYRTIHQRRSGIDNKNLYNIIFFWRDELVVLRN